MNMTPLDKWIANKINIPGRLDLKRLHEYQLEKLRETLTNVKKNSRFYRKHLAEINPSDIRDMADITRLPLTTPDDIASDPEGFLCVSPREVGRIVTLGTSGTTGMPKRVFFTNEDQEVTMDFFHHGMMTMTDEHDIVMIFMPGGTEGSVGDLLKRGLARFGCKSIVYGPIKDNTHALDMIVKEKITCMVGIPAQILSIARMSENSNYRISLKSVLLSADYVPLSAASVIKKAWGAPLYEHYGMTDMGLGGGVAGDAGEGYQLRESDLLFEVIDPVSAFQVQEGEYGEVVFSTLTRQGMPLIRYRTGDRARFLVDKCPCGTLLRRLDRITGRFAEPLMLADGNILSITQLDEILCKEPSILTYGAELQTVNGRDCLRIIVKPASGPSDPEALIRRIKMELPSLFKEEGLILYVEEGDVDYFTTGTLKRKILDSRL
jgi:phenylacetate-coenzyme A ligase PaaK-like adenylate-forming protein